MTGVEVEALVELSAHVHYESDQRDCDGTYLRGWTRFADELDETATDAHDVWRAALADVVWPADHAVLTVKGSSAVWSEPTDEGYRLVELELCERDCPREAPRQRDLSAEAAGY